jgi:hypothetical protein
MSKFVIEPNKIYDVLFGPFVFDDSLEADEEEEYEEA